MRDFSVQRSAVLGCLMTLMLALAWGGAEYHAATLSLGTRTLQLNPAPLWDGRELWLPVQHLSELGWNLSATSSTVRLNDLPPDQPHATLLITPIKPAPNQEPIPCVPIRDIVRRLGGLTRWHEETRTLTVLAFLRQVRIDGETGQLHLQTSLPVAWRTLNLNEPARLVVDLSGCALPENPPTPEGTHARVRNLRIGQFDPTTVRVVLEIETSLSTTWEGTARQWAISITGENPQVAQTESPAPTADPSQPLPIVPTFQMPQIERTDQGVQVRLSTTEPARPRISYLEDPLRIVLEVPGTLQETLEQVVEDPNLFIRALRAIPTEGGTVRLVLELTRTVGATLLTNRNNIAINLRMPRNTGGTLRQKIIVIDPGHGGNQPGARARHGNRWVEEKEIVLAIAKHVADRLSAEGATVIMTRGEDVALGLYARTELANNANAHFFISLHCDSNPRPNSASGTTIYFHKEDTDSRALGQAILNEMVKVTGLPSRGVRSDSTLYQSGLAVLRTSQMPAVLIEVGFLNHDTDRAKLIDPKFQERVAEAIVRGLKAHVEGR
ncbi:MAG: N-acetylmuramoyl-L-alanine amidase [Fimbriimonadales bacterium]